MAKELLERSSTEGYQKNPRSNVRDMEGARTYDLQANGVTP